MKQTIWVYKNESLGLMFGKVPIYFEKKSEEGNFEQGYLTLESNSQYDEIWGSDAKIEVSWEPIDRLTYHHGKKVRESMKVYGAIGIAVLKKETEWVKSHECTFWWGGRKQIIQKRLYATTCIHSVIFCEQTGRLFQIHGTIITSLMPNYESLVKDMITSIICHEI